MSVQQSGIFFFTCLYHLVVKTKGLYVDKKLGILEHTQFLTTKELRSLQKNKIKNILNNAANNVPFFKDAIQGKSHSTFSLEDFPFVTKKNIRQNPSAFLSLKKKGTLYKKTTGGSTGEALTVYKDASAFSNAMAATWRGYRWAGVGIGCKQARFWGIPITPTGKIKMRLTDFIAHRKRFSAPDERCRDYPQSFEDSCDD